ncbi:hypothetical protein FDE98_19735 [Clostridium sporogenes]|uniref:Phosphoadenosine phosphosulphate reductase domain-containing protein n=1 Tax=Clostridium sporogenes TaxID=1509 RepID=A0A7X5PBT4_CLOSG|nr:phosphoadenosine phosphosulfate reductase family protein [Clostridium sporogenes]AJD29381.1 phosphoadenosine phosphosulfate reductase family protein [Clostridium botulinum Prevot_594]NFL98550.1 hypothetical protein [Clostridium botulinum]NFP55494.1 hypothetical protein [Clostridium botulinum]NFQ18439.1 hypothetical protein [Clostridium sporogenes]NFQ21050.1 hypothetical protein [Clostridium sporogenes]
MYQENLMNYCQKEIKGEAFRYILKPFIYIELLDKKENIKKLERKYIRENQSFYNSWNNYDKWIDFENKYYGTKIYKETDDRICCYEIFTSVFSKLYTIGVVAIEVQKDNILIEHLIKYLLENKIKIRLFYRIQPLNNVNILKIDPKYKHKLIKAYVAISEEVAFKNELKNNDGETIHEIKEEILIRIKDAINYGYCRDHDGLINSFLKHCDAPKPENRASMVNILKKYSIKFTVDKIEGMKGYIKRLLQNYKVKLLQIIKRCKKIANFSGGKDSAFMIIKALEKGIKFDHIVFADTRLEYPEMYEYIDKFEQYIKQNVIRLKAKITFDDWFYKPFAYGKNEGKIHGFPYTIGDGCWVKRELKIKSMEAFKKSINEPVVDYIGIAADEPKRYKKLILEKQQAPLVDWGITENDCRNELESMGLLNPLYYKFKRLGCWLCPKQGMNSLRILYKDYPESWEKLKIYQQHDYKSFKPNLTVNDLERKILQQPNNCIGCI